MWDRFETKAKFKFKFLTSWFFCPWLKSVPGSSIFHYWCSLPTAVLKDELLLQVFFLIFDKKCRPITFRWLDDYFYLLLSLKMFSQKKSVLRQILKKLLMNILQNSHERIWQRCRPGGMKLYWKETPIQVFSCEFCEIFKNTQFEEHLWTTASASQIQQPATKYS